MKEKHNLVIFGLGFIQGFTYWKISPPGGISADVILGKIRKGEEEKVANVKEKGGKEEGERKKEKEK
jgi:hypothetical protein